MDQFSAIVAEALKLALAAGLIGPGGAVLVVLGLAVFTFLARKVGKLPLPAPEVPPPEATWSDAEHTPGGEFPSGG